MFNYDMYAICGDGDMMKGISGEAALLAGHLGLSNLCWIYDNNKITIEGNTSWAFTEDVATRFIAYGGNVTRVGDANDLEMIERAINTFKKTGDRPTLIIVDRHIAYGAPTKQDTRAADNQTYSLPGNLAQNVKATLGDWKATSKVQRLWALDADVATGLTTLQKAIEQALS
jgi:transketolase